MQKGDDPYEILGVGYDATESEIKKAYRKGALKYHPDKQQTEEDKEVAGAVFAKMADAYDTLTDPVKRYDWKSANEDKINGKKTKSAAPSKSTPGGGAAAKRQSAPAAAHSGRGGRGPPPGRGGRGPPPGGRGPPPGRGGRGRGPPPGGRGRGPPPQGGRGRGPPPQGGRGQPPSPQQKRPSGGGPPPPQQQRRPSSGPSPQQQQQKRSSGGGGGGGPPSGPPPNMQNYQKRMSAPVNPMQAPRANLTFRDPFAVFDEVMKEEFGDDYKNEEKSGWKIGKGVPGLAKMGNPFSAKKRESAHKEFKKLDINKDKSLSKDELQKYIETHSELWTMLGVKLDLGVQRCIEVATNVAYDLARGVGVNRPAQNEFHSKDLSEKEFKHFHKHYIQDEKGSKEFFLRTIFAAFDFNGDGVLQRSELAKFLDIFYDAKDVFKGKMRLPPKQELHRIVFQRLDTNRDGVLAYHEMKDLLEVAAVVASDTTSN